MVNSSGKSLFLKGVVPAALAICGGAVSVAQPAPEILSYRGCTERALSDPQAAYVSAEAWRVGGGGLPARHCEALALSGLGQYAEAARALEGLASEVRSGSTFEIGVGPDRSGPRMVAELYGQAGNAWLLGSQPERAIAAFTQGLLEAENAPEAALELFLDRAFAAATMEQYEVAVADLDRALAQRPGRSDIHILRAVALRNLGQGEAAHAALERALLISPDDRRALLERASLRASELDDVGAEADLRRVIALYPVSDEAGAAVRMLGALVDGRERGAFAIDSEPDPEPEPKPGN